jgi:hypothetical protein
MNNYLISEISSIAIHNVGNKLNDDGIQFSKELTNFESDLMETLITYFISSFKSAEYFTLHHESDITLNEVYVYAGKIFDDPSTLYENSVNLAKHLYNCTSHPKIKGGEFYTVYFKNCTFEGNTVDAIGLFKSENKDTFLKVKPRQLIYEIESEKGININKLDKGCLIFNTKRENGFVVEVVDNTGKGTEAVYWMDNFLQSVSRKDDYHHTENVLSLCKKFITNDLPREYEVTKADQADFLNKSLKFFKGKESFNMNEFASEVIEQPALIEKFHNYKSSFEEQSSLNIMDNFNISAAALKKQSRVFRSVLKLDKNFHVYIHGDRELIEQGVDPDGRKFYKLYFREES